MNEPRRLNRSGGISQRLLDSASLDRPSQASRRHATNLANTASAFASSSSRTKRVPQGGASTGKVVTWILVGAAASVTLGFVGTELLESPPATGAAAPLLTAPTPRGAAASSPDIAAEPATPATARPSSEEARDIEAARGALNRGDADSTIAQLDAYDAAHPHGQLKPEALALRIQALSKVGKTTEARRLADEFRAKYPDRQLPAR